MQENFITWNVSNWITVALMAFSGFALLTLLSTTARNFLGSRVTPETETE